MLMLKLRAQLGNQMFEYAAVRTLAERRGLPFCFRGGAKGKIWEAFDLGGDTEPRRALRRAGWACRPPWMKHGYAPPRRIESGVTVEDFDSGFSMIPDHTLVEGMFQCDRYFAENRAAVLRWFTPRARFREQIEAVARQLPAAAERRCCIHIRRGDYLRVDQGLAVADQGWAIPLEYYHLALRRVPTGLSFVVITDDPDFAREHFGSLKDCYIASGNPGVVDMFLLTRCRFNIIANSSFSWWGAWLNDTPGKAVIGPRYHLGWSKRAWIPPEIAVSGWDYVDP